MKILEIIPQLSQGGAEKFVVDLANQLSEHHDVTLVVLHKKDENSLFFDKIGPGVKVITLEKKAGFDFKMFVRINNLVKKCRPDIIHTHLRSILYVMYTFVLHRKIKFIHTVHNDAQMEAGGLLGKLIRNILFRLGVTPVTISDNSKKSFTTFYNLPSELIYNGASEYTVTENLDETRGVISKIRKSESSLLLVNIARISAQKNQQMLVDAVANLRNRGYDIELMIIGACEDEQRKEKILSCNYDFIHIMGSRSNPRDYVKLADAFCLSSLYEGMPISLIECFSVGTIPICTPVGGINDMIVDGENGILTSGINVQSIEEAILRFISMTTRAREEMKHNSLMTFDKYSMQSCAYQYENLMFKLLEDE